MSEVLLYTVFLCCLSASRKRRTHVHQPPEVNYLGRFENDDSPCSIASAEAIVQGKSIEG